MLSSSNIQALDVRRKLAWVQIMHMLLNRKFQMNPELHLQPVTSRVTRHYHQLCVAYIFIKNGVFKLSYFPRTINDLNALPRKLFQGLNFERAIEEYLSL